MINFSNALIPDSTRASLPQKYGFQAGFMDSNVSLSLIFFLMYGLRDELKFPGTFPHNSVNFNLLFLKTVTAAARRLHVSSMAFVICSLSS